MVSGSRQQQMGSQISKSATNEISVDPISFPPTSYTRLQWEARLNAFPVSKAELNALIMNYLIVEGYQDAALEFAQEAQIPVASSTSLASDALISAEEQKQTFNSSGANSLKNPFAHDFTVDQKLSQDGQDSQEQHPGSLYYHQRPPLYSLDAVRDRMKIKSLIHAGCIQQAIELINDLYPDLLDTNSVLHFSLLRLQLIELIRKANNQRRVLSDHRRKANESSSKTNVKKKSKVIPSAEEIDDIELIQPALEFASSHLATRVVSNPRFLKHFQETMALLCFPPDKLAPELAHLMDLDLRYKVAQDVNTFILARQGIAGESNIRSLIRLWGWAEHELDKLNVDVPLLEPYSLQ